MKILISLFVVILSCLPSNAAPPADLGMAKPHLYAIEFGGKVSFLFGTRHSKIDLAKFPDYLLRAFHSRAITASEIVTTLEDGSYPPYSAPEKEPPQLPFPSPAAAEILRARGIPEDLFTSPFICNFFYTWDPSDILSLDAALEALARQHKKPVEAFELPEDLTKIDVNVDQRNASCDIEEATKYLSVESLVKDHEKVMNNYFAGKLELIDPCDEHCEERSLKWIPKLEELHSRKGVFAFVSIGHLAGPKGLVEQLRLKKYRVTQVESLAQLHAILSSERR